MPHGVEAHLGSTMKKIVRLEGLDGGGKSTTAEVLETTLRLRGYNVLRVHEPGSTPLAEKLRSLALDDPEPRSNLTELLIFLTARSALMDSLEASQADIIISDRGYPSTWVYQVKDDITQVMYDRTVNLLRPDVPTVSVLLSCSYETYLARRGEKREGSDNIERRLKSKEAYEELTERYKSFPGGYDMHFETDNITPAEIVGEILKCLSQ